MRTRKAMFAVAGAVALGGWAVHAQHARTTGAPAPGKSLTQSILVQPNELQWKDGPPSLPRGIKAAPLEGDPATPDRLFTVRLKLPANAQIAPHFHGTDEHVTVLSGEFQLGMGEKASENAYRSYRAGAFVAMPAGHAHFARAKVETVIQLHGMGPWTITYVNPEDDPRRGVGGSGEPPRKAP